MSEAATMNIRQWAEGLRGFAEQAGGTLAEGTAQVMKAEVVKAVKAGRSVDGVAWLPRKADGAQRLQNADKAVTARAEGTTALIVLEGVEVFHHYGAGRVPRSPILPSGGTDKLGNAIRRGIVTMCDEWMTRIGRHDKGAKGVKWNPSMGGGT